MPLHKGQGNERFREALARAISVAVEFPQGVFITVLDAKISPSQHDAVVTLSAFPANSQDVVIRSLATFKHALNDHMAQDMHLRFIPKIQWRFDENGAYVQTIDEVIDELKKKGDL